ncbi:hypothetical protein KJ865_14250, partial [Myxococcota bacterium]|nr:hypothetical protein [Myxococcota bacterium]
QWAKNTDIKNPQLPQGVTQHLKKLSGQGRGTITVDLTKPVPSSKASTMVNMFTVLKKENSSNTMDMNISMDLTVLLSYLP